MKRPSFLLYVTVYLFAFISPSFGQFNPVDLSNITERSELKQAIDRVIAQATAENYIFPGEPVLYHYATTNRIQLQVRNGALRYSPGISAPDRRYQIGSFPEGAYAGAIAPYDTVTLADMATSYYSKDGVTYFNAESFLMTAAGLPRTRAEPSWEPYGYLDHPVVSRKYANYEQRFSHFVLPFNAESPNVVQVWDVNRNVPHLKARILAYGQPAIERGQQWDILTRMEAAPVAPEARLLPSSVAESYRDWRTTTRSLFFNE